MFLSEFSSNFSVATDVSLCVDYSMGNNSGFMPYCTELLVMEALINCPSSNSRPDGFSYNILKMISRFVIRPLNIVFQQSLAAGVFSSVWKHAIIIPLYKGRGERTSPSSYRPISLCSCLGKLLERVVQSQLTTFLQSINLLWKMQHGFIASKSTLTNILRVTPLLLKPCLQATLTTSYLSISRQHLTKRRIVLSSKRWPAKMCVDLPYVGMPASFLIGLNRLRSMIVYLPLGTSSLVLYREVPVGLGSSPCLPIPC